ncbi:MAG: hypothetical protein K2Z81_17490, partial [Cyanobacteria bacterium]|nr:hypothetical protein [Cyanobacteriota bacterium]
ERRQIKVEETIGRTYKVRVGTPEGGAKLHVSLNHEIDRPGELIEVYARMGKPGAVEAGLFEAVGRLASAFLQYASEFGEEERAKAENTLISQLVNIQSGYPAFFKFSDSDKAVVVQSPCDGLAKAIQHYRRHYDNPENPQEPVVIGELNTHEEPGQSVRNTRMTPCSKCGGADWLRIDGCNVCQSCGFSKCG